MLRIFSLKRDEKQMKFILMKIRLIISDTLIQLFQALNMALVNKKIR
jgi:hypothetical protein